MSKKFSLQTLLDLSNVRLDESAKRLGELVANEQVASKRLDLLTAYRDEYQARFVAEAQSGLSPQAWQNYREFLSRLDSAITQAKGDVQQSHRNTLYGQEKWLEQRGKVKAFDTLAERHEKRVQYGENRQDQKQLDEFSSRQFQFGSQNWSK